MVQQKKGFKRATKKAAKLRLAVFGPSGSGKTFSSLRIATGIGGSIAVIDTERGSASKYADRFEFDVLELEDKTIDGYVEAIEMAHGYSVLLIDSMTHAWQELLEQVDALARAKYRGNTWSAWSEGTPKQRQLVQAVLNFPGHVISTMRSKTAWGEEKDRNGKMRPVRVGLAPEQGKGIEYEYDMLLEVNPEHFATVIKDRTGKFQDKVLEKPDEKFGQALAAWLDEGLPPRPPETEAPKEGRNGIKHVRRHVENLGMKAPETDPAALLEALQGAAHAEDRRAYYLNWQRSRRLDGRGLRLLGALMHGDANAEGGKEPEDGMGEDERQALAEAYALLDEQDAAAERAAVQEADQPSLVEGQAAPEHAGPVGQVER